MTEAKKLGKVRYVGFTGHKNPSVRLRMLELAEKRKFEFDTVQMPLNVIDAHFRSFGKEVLPVLVKKDIGVLGMKSMASGHILKSKTVSAIDCLHYALSLPTSVVITGVDSMAVLDQAFEAAKTFSKVSKEDHATIFEKTRSSALNGLFEPFKTSAIFDSTVSSSRMAWLQSPNGMATWRKSLCGLRKEKSQQ
jgi:predicted aldo/keto reductase-like oxidoreductase